MAKHSAHILQLAKRGAEVRFRELLDELKFLTLSFPHLRDAVDRDDLPVKFLLRQGGEKADTRSGRKLSAAARRAVSGARTARRGTQKAAKKS